MAYKIESWLGNDLNLRVSSGMEIKASTTYTHSNGTILCVEYVEDIEELERMIKDNLHFWIERGWGK